MAARIHVSGTPQVLDPVSVQDHETVADGHVGKWVAFTGVNATGQGNVLFDVHAHIVQQIHSQRNQGPSKASPRSNSGFYIDFFRVMYVLFFSKSQSARILCELHPLTMCNELCSHNPLISLNYYTITSITSNLKKKIKKTR